MKGRLRKEIMTRQEFEGKQQIDEALKNVGLDLHTFISSIDNDEYDEDEYLKAQGRLLKSIVYPEDDDCELGNNAEPLKEYPDLPDFEIDPMDLAKNNFLDKFQEGY